MAGWIRSLAARTVAGMGVLDIAAAILLSALAAGLTSGLLHPTYRAPDLGAAAAAGVLAMTAPVAWRRSRPLAMAGAVAAGAVLNGLVFGPMVRCGAALPAVFLIVYAVGEHCDRIPALAGLALCALNTDVECVYDPQLGQRVLLLMLPVLSGFFTAGWLVRSRNAVADKLRQRSAELRQQRELTARQAVRADRIRVADDLDATLRERIAGIARSVTAGRAAMAGDPETARRALSGIEHSGREILHEMRQVVGTLQEAPTEPLPTLAGLGELLRRSTAADARLTVTGSARTLAAGLELSGVRIVEHLLQALDDVPTSKVEVRLTFGPDVLMVNVSGPASPSADPEAALALARHRAALHGGTVEGLARDGSYSATARLPLVSYLT